MGQQNKKVLSKVKKSLDLKSRTSIKKVPPNLDFLSQHPLNILMINILAFVISLSENNSNLHSYKYTIVIETLDQR